MPRPAIPSGKSATGINPRNKNPHQSGKSTGKETTDRRSKPVEPSPNSYFNTFLQESLSTTAALAGQVWGLNEIGQLTKIASSNPKVFQIFEQLEFVDYHRNLLSQVLATGSPSETCLKDEDESNELSQRIILLSPLFLENQVVGIVELILAKPAGDDSLTQFGVLLSHAEQYLIDQSQNKHRQSEQIARNPNAHRVPPVPTPNSDSFNQKIDPRLQLPADGSDNGDADGLSDRKNSQSVSAESVEELVLLLHNQSDLPYVASTAVNETRRIIECDRVSLATMTGRRCEVAAVSGQDSLLRKSDTVVAMQNLAEQVIKSGSEINFESGKISNAAVAENAGLEFLEVSGASWFTAVPLFEPEKIDFESSVHVAEMKPFAALILEKFSDKPVPQLQSIERLGVHISQALFHAAQAEQVFLLPLRRRIGRWASLAKLTRTKVVAVLTALVLFICALVFVEAPYHVVATGRLMPVQQFRAYAPFDGQVREVLVQSEQHVEAGQNLAVIHGETLVTQALALNNDLAEKRKLLEAYKAQQDSQAENLSPSDQTSLSAKIIQYELEINGLLEQLELTNRVLAQSEIKSTINGTVATFQPGELLNERPVARGDLLLEVMNESGPWRLELQVPAKRIGHLMETSSINQQVHRVSFIQATSPEQTFAGSISEISKRVSNADDGSSTVEVFASIEPSQPLRRTIGAEVTAKIQCGNRSLGYVWFGDIIDWFRSKIW